MISLFPQKHTINKNASGEETERGRTTRGEGGKQAFTVSRELSVQIPQRRKRSEDYEGECNNDDAAEVLLSKA